MIAMPEPIKAAKPSKPESAAESWAALDRRDSAEWFMLVAGHANGTIDGPAAAKALRFMGRELADLERDTAVYQRRQRLSEDLLQGGPAREAELASIDQQILDEHSRHQQSEREFRERLTALQILRMEHADHLDRAKAARNELIQVSPEGVALVRQRHAKDIEVAAGDPEKLAAIERLIEADMLSPGIW